MDAKIWTCAALGSARDRINGQLNACIATDCRQPATLSADGVFSPTPAFDYVSTHLFWLSTPSDLAGTESLAGGVECCQSKMRVIT